MTHKPPVRRIAGYREAEILDDEIVRFADELTLALFFADEEDRCLYLYDFGDGWDHLVQLRDVVELKKRYTRRLLDGAMGCPPEDCGGPIGYEEMLEYVNMTEEQFAMLDERGRPEIEWLRKKYRGLMMNPFDLALAGANFGC